MTNTSRAILFAAALAVCGCASGTKTKTQKEQAAAQWAGTRATVLASLAGDQYRAGNFEKSRQTVDQAIALDPTSARLHLLSARLDIEQGRLEPADRSLKLAATLDEKDAEIDYLQGIVQQRWQRTEAALASYARAAAKKPDDVAYPLAQAEMLVQLDRRPEALRLLTSRVTYFEHSASIRDAIGQLWQQQGALGQAIDAYRQAVVLDAADVGIRERLALALYESGEHREALAQINRVLAANQSAADSPRADLMLAAAECELALDDARAARSRFEDVAAIEPKWIDAWLGAAKASLRLGDLRRADYAATKAVTLRPRSADAQMVMGYVRLRQDRDDEALAAFTRASAAADADGLGLSMMGIVAERKGDRPAAERYYRQALAMNPGDELAQRLVASVAD